MQNLTRLELIKKAQMKINKEVRDQKALARLCDQIQDIDYCVNQDDQIKTIKSILLMF